MLRNYLYWIGTDQFWSDFWMYIQFYQINISRRFFVWFRHKPKFNSFFRSYKRSAKRLVWKTRSWDYQFFLKYRLNCKPVAHNFNFRSFFIFYNTQNFDMLQRKRNCKESWCFRNIIASKRRYKLLSCYFEVL